MLVQVNDWMENLLYDDADDLYRFKGVLAIEDWPDRFIFQVSLVPCLSAAHPSQCSILVASCCILPSTAESCVRSNKDITGV